MAGPQLDPMAQNPLASSQPSGPSSTPSFPGQMPANRTEAQNQLAQIAAAQQQADQTASAPSQSSGDSGHGWSLTNPFQDIGQIWHDVESHTVSPVFHAAHWAYTNLVSRPLSTGILYTAQVPFGGSISPFNGSQWKTSWDESAHISPGQALVIAENNSPVEQRLTKPGDLPAAAIGTGHRFIDPSDPNQIDAVFRHNNTKNHANVTFQSGMADALAGWFLDPTTKLTKGTKVLKDIKDVPITRADNADQIAAKLSAPRSQAFNEWAVGKKISVLAEHPLVKGTFGRANPYANKFAALLAGAKTPEEVALLRKIAYDVDPDVTSGLDKLAADQAKEVSVSDKAFDDLAQKHLDTAVQAANMFSPLDISIKWATTAMSDAEKDAWLGTVSRTKAMAAQAMLDLDPEEIQSLVKLRGSGLAATASTNLANRLAELRGSLKYANTHESDAISFIRKAYYNLPVRIYQGLVDKPPGMINHNEDDGITAARSWLNKSSVLTEEQKVDYVSRYANATPAQRQHVWRDIENDVYKNVGDSYGIPEDTMKRILTTTRSKGQNYIQMARSKAFGGIKIGDEEHAILPSADDEVVLHPQFLAQLERGAIPQANLKDLENALEAMNRTGVLSGVINGGYRRWDTLKTLLDNVYGIWKPMSLMTGHRAFNHVGDDQLRSITRLGALTSIGNLAEGTYNFLKNSYSRVSRDAIVQNIYHKHQMAVGDARAEWEGLKARAAREKELRVPKIWRTDPKEIAQAKATYKMLRDLDLDFVAEHHRLGEGTFKIAGSNLDYSEMFGGPNADYMRWLTSSHPTWNATVGETAQRLHDTGTAIRSGNYGTINPTDVTHTRAYVHYVRNQIMSDPVGRMVVQGRDLTDVGRWLSSTPEGRAHMRALHIGDPDRHVAEIASEVRTMLPTDEMRDAAAKGRFDAKVIEKAMPNAGVRPAVPGALGTSLHGGDPITNWLRNSMDKVMHWTGTLPDDALVRHPFVNEMYKHRLTDAVQRFITTRGRDITADELGVLQEGAMRGARKDMQNTLYDVSRFNDAGHTLRFISPFFNAWFNAMSSWSHLFMENPGLLGRTYQAKKALWDSPLAVNTATGQKADVTTPWDQTAFVVHLPKGLAKHLGGLGSIPIDAKTLISPTYIDAIGNPGFGPVVSVPVNQIVKDHPSLMNDAVVRSMLNEMVDKNSMAQLLPSGMRDVQTLSQILTGSPDSSQQYASTVWSIYQEQQYDYLNGQRHAPPNWSDVENQAKYLTVLDLVANRLMPLGFKPAAPHSNLIEEYHGMLDKDPKNARQDFYNKYGPAGMVFTQSLTTNPTGIPATVGADKLINKYSSMVAQYPELGAVIVGPNGNGAYDQMAYDWQVAKGLRKSLTPQEAAAQANVNTGWAQYGVVHAAAMAQLQARGLSSLNDPRAKDIKSQLSNFVSLAGDPNDKQHYNPDWLHDYSSYNQADYQTRLTNLLIIAQDPKLLANGTRSDIKSLQDYSQKRDEIYARLQQRSNKSISAARNQDIARDLDQWIADRMHADTKFGPLYERYLSKDDFKEPI